MDIPKSRVFVVTGASVAVLDRKANRRRTLSKGKLLDLDALGIESVTDLGDRIYPDYLRVANEEDAVAGLTPEELDLRTVREELSRVERVAQYSQQQLDGLSDAELLETLRVARPDMAARLGDRLNKATREQLMGGFRPVTRLEEANEEAERLAQAQAAGRVQAAVPPQPAAAQQAAAAAHAAQVAAQPPTNGGQSGGGAAGGCLLYTSPSPRD